MNDLFTMCVIGRIMLFNVCLSNLVDISSWPKLDFDFNLWTLFVISEGNNMWTMYVCMHMHI